MKFIKAITTVFLLLTILLLAYHIFRKNHFISKEKAIATFAYPNSQFIDWEGKKIHLIERGSGTTVFLVHGLGAGLHEFEELSIKLAEEYKVVSFDLPGFGLSDIPDGKNPDFQEIYSDFMNFIINKYADDSCYIVGNSMGGLITWNTVLNNPVKIKKMILLGSAGYEMEKIAKENAAWINTPVVKFLLAKGAPRYIAKDNVKMCFFYDDVINENYFDRKYGVMNKEGNLDYLKKFATYKKFTDTVLIKTITCPTLIIWGNKDEIIPYNHAARFDRDLPNSKLITYDNCGHVPMIEEVDKCAKDILSFLSLP